MSLPAARRKEKWEMVFPGLTRKAAPVTRGPWFQYRDPVGFEWNTFEVYLTDLPAALDGFRFVQISDLHCRPDWQTAYDDLIDRLGAEEPDLILITGDIVDDTQYPHKCLPTARRLLSQFRAPQGVLGVRGNHDENVDAEDFNSTPLRLIDGRRLLLGHRGAAVELIAIPGPLRADYPVGFEDSLPPKAAGVPRIVMSHYPDHFRRMRATAPDIFVCGHTHGGQICLPGPLPLLRHDSLPMRYFLGVHRLDKTHFFVNRGFGFSTQQVRLFCPSEVIEIRLRRNAEVRMQNAECR